MSGGNRWQDGRRVWARLSGWQQGDPSKHGHVHDGSSALEALADVGFLRRLLDQAELSAVRTSRRHGKSWAEIATQLGITRQAAWERWRDLDDVPPIATATPSATATAIANAAAELVEQAAIDRDLPDQIRAWSRRRQSSVVVPNVVGMQWSDARQELQGKGLIGVGPDQDGPPLAALGWPDGVVMDQTPESGARVAPGSPVTLWVDRGGGTVVREPRRPKPGPRTGREMRDEPSGEAVG